MTEHVEPAGPVTFPLCMRSGFAGNSRSARPRAKTLKIVGRDEHSAACVGRRKIYVTCYIHVISFIERKSVAHVLCDTLLKA